MPNKSSKRVIFILIFLLVVVGFFTSLFSRYIFSNKGSYRVIKQDTIAVYDPYIFRKQFIPLPKKRGAVVSLDGLYKNPVIEAVLSPETAYIIEFFNRKKSSAKINIYVDDSGRSIIDVPLEAHGRGYNEIRFTPVSGRNQYIAYLGFLENREQSVVYKEIPPLLKTGWSFNQARNPNASPRDLIGIIPYLIRDSETGISLQIQTISEIDVELLNIVNEKGKKIAFFPPNTVIKCFEETGDRLLDFHAEFTGKRRSYKPNKLFVEYRYTDSDKKKTVKINLFPPVDDAVFYGTEIRTKTNLDTFDFITLDGNTVTFNTNEITLERSLFVPEDKNLRLLPGQNIDLRNGAMIVCRSWITVEGTKENPVKLFSGDGAGQGLVVLQGEKRSDVRYLICDNLGEIHNGIYALTGCVTFYESDVDFYGCSFLNNRSEDGLNIIRSNFRITDCVFSNTESDAFDADFCTGTVEGCFFELTGNDALDVSTSELTVLNCVFRNIGDKAVSVGEASTAHIENIDVENAQMCIGAKDNSRVSAKNIIGKNIFIGYAAYQKKPEFGHSEASIENIKLSGKTDFDYLIEGNEKLTIDGRVKLPRGKKKEAIIIERIINEVPIH